MAPHSRLIHRYRRRKDQRAGFTVPQYTRMLQEALQQLPGFYLPAYAPELNPAETV